MHKRLTIFVVLVGALLQQGAIANGEQRSQSSKPLAQKGTSTSTSDSGDLLLQRERLELDKQKFLSDTNIENKKLEVERDKVQVERSTSKWSAFSAVAPLTIALGTLVFSIWSFHRQGRVQSSMQLEAAKLQFEIKAAEIAFSGKTATAVVNRAKALKIIFPDRLPDDFTKGFSPTDFGANKEPSDEKKVFLDFILKYPGREAEVVALWAQLFPGDQGWLERVNIQPKS